MQPKQSARPGVPAGATETVVFTVDSANRALVLVRRIVEDIVRRYQDLMSLRAERELLAGAGPEVERRGADLRDQIEKRIDALNRLAAELGEVGVELKDWATGLVDFPAIRDGKRVLLCWRLGESEVAHWHDLHSGFSGRQPVDETM